MNNSTLTRRYHTLLSRCLIGLTALLIAGPSFSQPPVSVAHISIIIDDMGDQGMLGRQALTLPGPLTYAFLPHSPHGPTQAKQAHDLGKEVMLHLPMQAMTSNKLGPGGITLDMNRQQFNQTLQQGLASIPHVVGINNHMGSLLTRHPGHMRWLMEALKTNGELFFIDSRTTHHTIAARIASENQIPSRERDVFLDDDPSVEAINFQFQRLIDKALKTGKAIGIGHPYANTIQVLKQQLPRLAAKGIAVVPVSTLLNQPVVRVADEAPHAIESLVYNQHLTTPQTN